MAIIKEKYEKRISQYHDLIEKQTKEINHISNLRFIVFFGGISAALALYVIKYYYLSAAAMVLFLTGFIYLIIEHQRLIQSKSYSTILYEINDQSLRRLNNEWKAFADAGSDFKDIQHSYTEDLDIFGQGSLFQYMNTARTYNGRRKLASILAEPDKHPEGISLRQDAVIELGEKLEWRQKFMAEAIMGPEKMHDPEFLFIWAEDVNRFYTRTSVTIFFKLMPIATVLLLILSFISPLVPYHAPAAAVLLQYLLLRYRRKERKAAFETVYKYKENIRNYSHMLHLIEEKSFEAEYLKCEKNKLLDKRKNTTYQQIKRLSKIVDSISNRYNIYFYIFNILTLWDYQNMIALENWKDSSGKLLRSWMDVIGEFEALSSLAVIRHDHPDWAIPAFRHDLMGIKADGIGHPLLSETRVYNDLTAEPPGGILLITGSNMSGKSTLLRTAGINLVLAYAGAPVCAKKFTCSIMDIHTCMRISDNLEMSISSFYAELLRIKMIIKAVEDGKKIFFLLDEIFKGTNSIDRHTGARILVRKLLKEGAIGLVSTHDLELGSLEEESEGRIKNYHFREYYRDNEIYFDYKLRSGVSTTRNAMYLMKLAGIED